MSKKTQAGKLQTPTLKRAGVRGFGLVPTEDLALLDPDESTREESDGADGPTVYALRRSAGTAGGEPEQGPTSRRQVLKGALAAASLAGVVTTAEGEAEARSRRGRTYGAACVYTELRAFKNKVAAIYPFEDGEHLAAVDSMGWMNVWRLDRPNKPRISRAIPSVIHMATGKRGEFFWLTRDRIQGRRLSRPTRDIFKVKVQQIDFIAWDARAQMVIALSRDSEITRYDLKTGKQVGGTLTRAPREVSEPDQIFVTPTGDLWLRAKGTVYCLSMSSTPRWKKVFEEPRATHCKIDPLAQRVVVAVDGQLKVYRLPSGKPLHRSVTLARVNKEVYFESWLRSAAQMDRDRLRPACRLYGLDGGTTSAPRTVSLGTARPTVFEGLPLRRGYAWGDADGRLAYFDLDRQGRVVKTPLFCKAATVHGVENGRCSGIPRLGWACTCDTVAMRPGKRMRLWSGWDSKRGVTYGGTRRRADTQCACNSVMVGTPDRVKAACTCLRVCTCDSMCTCQSYCSCQYTGCSCQYTGGGHYWRSN